MGPPTSLISSASYFNLGIWGVKALSGWLKGEGSEYWAPCGRVPPYWEVWSAADTALFVAIWHQKRIRVKLNNGLLTNENEETDTEFHQIIYCDL